MSDFVYSKEFDEKNAYDGKDLGAVCTVSGTNFKVWAPFAEKVELNIYGENGEGLNSCDAGDKSCKSSDGENLCGTGGKPCVVEMKKGERCVWHSFIEGDLHGRYYDYTIYGNDETVRTADPYAVGCGCNGSPSMVVDLARTDPEGFKEDIAPVRPVENIIYELHIKDFSYDSDSGVPKEYRGKFKAFTVDTSTCVEYLKELGITHLHLLPFYDYGWLDEEGSDKQFNWGYDPVNYNVPEGSYATDVHDGLVRIRECKEMVQALHKAGIRVVMDVVYNHTYEPDCFLERTAKGYYNRYFEDGTLVNGSCCGSDIAAGRRMVDNYIANSVMYWAKEYHIDGFRFDLMGLLTVELMNRIRKELDAEFGKGEKLLYGEPWRADDSLMEEGTLPALKENVRHLDDGIAVFSDDTRDVVKGHVFFEDEPGFVNGAKNLEKKVLRMVTGWCADSEGIENRFENGKDGEIDSEDDRDEELHPKSCAQVINYVSAHDNLTLWDKLVLTLHGKEADFSTRYEDVLSANKLAALMYFTSQGNIFFQAGEEFGRTKFGDENSYRSDPEINMLRWKQTEEFGGLLSYYKGLISLRKKMPGLWDKSEKAVKRISERKIIGEKAVSFRLNNTPSKEQEDLIGKDSGFSELFVIYNASENEIGTEIPTGEWNILADAERTDICEKAELGGSNMIRVPACSGIILGKRS